uniref:Uncharacterized protein n=1 Tax=Anguilla anguilla TaxID=7936 RepID=A0A0E9PTM3_ANGAN
MRVGEKKHCTTTTSTFFLLTTLFS